MNDELFNEMYDARNVYESPSLETQNSLLNRRCTLPLTGVIYEFRDGPNGVYAMIRIDERWGFTEVMGCDIEALVIENV